VFGQGNFEVKGGGGKIRVKWLLILDMVNYGCGEGMSIFWDGLGYSKRF